MSQQLDTPALQGVAPDSSLAKAPGQGQWDMVGNRGSALTRCMTNLLPPLSLSSPWMYNMEQSDDH